MLSLILSLFQFGGHGDVLSKGVGGGRQPISQPAETHRRPRLHSRRPGGVSKNDGTR